MSLWYTTKLATYTDFLPIAITLPTQHVVGCFSLFYNIDKALILQ